MINCAPTVYDLHLNIRTTKIANHIILMHVPHFPGFNYELIVSQKSLQKRKTKYFI